MAAAAAAAAEDRNVSAPARGSRSRSSSWRQASSLGRQDRQLHLSPAATRSYEGRRGGNVNANDNVNGTRTRNDAGRYRSPGDEHEPSPGFRSEQVVDNDDDDTRRRTGSENRRTSRNSSASSSSAAERAEDRRAENASGRRRGGWFPFSWGSGGDNGSGNGSSGAGSPKEGAAEKSSSGSGGEGGLRDGDGRGSGSNRDRTGGDLSEDFLRSLTGGAWDEDDGGGYGGEDSVGDDDVGGVAMRPGLQRSGSLGFRQFHVRWARARDSLGEGGGGGEGGEGSGRASCAAVGYVTLAGGK